MDVERPATLGLARIAWLARGFAHLAVAFVALWALRTRPAGGATIALLSRPWGKPLLCATATAMAIWALWRVVDAASPSAPDRERTVGKLLSAGTYLALAAWLGDLVIDGHLLAWTGLDGLLAASRSGRAAVGFVLRTAIGPYLLIGLAVVLVLLGMGQIAAAEVRRWGRFQVTPRLAAVADTLGVLGFVGRGMVLVGIGLALGFAGILSLPGTTGEPDLVFDFLRRPGVGLSVYGLVAAACLAFGLFAVVEAVGSRPLRPSGELGTVE